MQLQYCLIKRRNPNMADTTIFSTSIYGISVTFVDVITSDTPIIIDNDVIAEVLIWIFSSYMEITNFSTQRHVWILSFTKLHALSPASRLNKLLVEDSAARTCVEDFTHLLVVTCKWNEDYLSKSCRYQKTGVKKEVGVYIGNDSSCQPVCK